MSEKNAVLENIQSRRSVRKFKPDMIPGEILDQILEAGTCAPTGMNRQSPIIIAVTNKEVRDRLSAHNARIMGSSSDPFYGAPVVLIVLANKSCPYPCLRRQPGHGKPHAGRARFGNWQLLDSPRQRRI